MSSDSDPTEPVGPAGTSGSDPISFGTTPNNEGSTPKGGGFLSIRTTMPDEILRHEISDEELTMLGVQQHSNWREYALLALGIGLGAAIPAIRHVVDAYDKTPTPMSGADLAEVIYCAVFLAIGGALLAVHIVQGRTYKNLAKTIRDRTNSRLAGQPNG